MTEDKRSQEEEAEQAERGFKVEDRRRFSQSGESRGEVGRADESDDTGVERSAKTAGEGDTEASSRATSSHDAVGREITFSSFAFGLASQALMLLGLAPDPASGVVHKDLAQAQDLIDILAMLEEKTRGNLDEDEAHMMEEMLYELRMQYVRETRGHSDPQETS